jgi:hypothetical protein
VNRLVTIQSINSLHTQEYFALLSSLINHHYMLRDKAPFAYQPLFDVKSLTVNVLRMLMGYQSSESRQRQAVDNTLVGLLQTIRDLILYEPDVLTQPQKSEVLQMIVEKCLFNRQSQQFTEHVTAKVDLHQLNQQSMNKCHSDESREAAYTLFQALIGNNPNTQTLQELVGKYWAPAIMSLSQTKNQQFASKDQGNRSPLGFAGIRNLGCVCYMNAIIQQFYHVPAFRYCLLACDD